MAHKKELTIDEKTTVSNKEEFIKLIKETDLTFNSLFPTSDGFNTVRTQRPYWAPLKKR